MSIEDIIISTIVNNYRDGWNYTTIEELYNACKPHSQSLIERKCRLIKEKGRWWQGRIWNIDIAGIGTHKKITAYKVVEQLVKEDKKTEIPLLTNQPSLAI